MHFLTEGTSFMPKGILHVYEELLKLRMILDSTQYSHLPNVSNCINLINHLIKETYQQYLEIMKLNEVECLRPQPFLLS